MAIENIIPDPSQTEVLLAGNIADDDLMWVARCSVGELHRLFESPVAWVAGLATLPGWRYYGSEGPAPAAVLTRDFAMLVGTTHSDGQDGWVVVQGISGTNELSLLVSRSSGRLSAEAMGLPATEEDPFGPFWEEVSRDPENPPSLKKRLPVNVVVPAARFYAHFELRDRSETRPETAARVATFALACALDPDGFAGMLAGLDQEALYADRGVIEKGAPIAIRSGGAQAVVYANVDASTAGVLRGDGEDDPVDDDIACGFVNGHWLPIDGEGVPEGTVIKRWGVDGPPTGP